VLPPILALAPAELGLDNERAAVNSVDHRVATETGLADRSLKGKTNDINEPGEGKVAPGAGVPNRRALAGKVIILGEHIKVGNLLDLAGVGVLGDRADIQDAKTGLVVGLVGETLVDELVVVDRAGGRFVVSCVLWGFQAGDIPHI
jgi:hypothetical protein